MKMYEQIKDIGFTCGAWDLLHAGHIIFLQECAARCDQLIVGLHTDPTIDRPEKNKPIQSTFERWVQLFYVKGISSIIPYDTEHDLTLILASNNIDVRFLGSEYIDKPITGNLSVPVEYIDRNHSYSSSELRKRIYDAENLKVYG